MTAPATFLDARVPYDEAAERAVLGACLHGGAAAFNDAIALLKPADFHRAALGQAFQAIWDLALRSEPIDPITLARELQREQYPLWQGVDPGPIFSEWSDEVGAWERVETYARIVREGAIRRSVMRACYYGIQSASEGSDPQQAINDLVCTLQGIQSHGEEGDARRLADLIPDALNGRGPGGGAAAMPTMRTGISGLDEVFRTLRPGYLVTLSGRPGEGKTTLMELIARHVAESAGPVLIWSGECPRAVQVQRFLAMESLQPTSAIASRNPAEPPSQALSIAAQRLSNLPIWICDERRPATFAHLEATARAVMREEGRPLALLGLDRVELLPEGADLELNAASFRRVHGVKSLVMRLGCLGLLLAQPSEKRERERRKTPSIRDIQYGAAVRQDSQAVLMLEREDYERDADLPRTGNARVWVMKHNDGRSGGAIDMHFRENLPAFFNDEHEYIVRLQEG